MRRVLELVALVALVWGVLATLGMVVWYRLMADGRAWDGDTWPDARDATQQQTADPHGRIVKWPPRPKE